MLHECSYTNSVAAFHSRLTASSGKTLREILSFVYANRELIPRRIRHAFSLKNYCADEIGDVLSATQAQVYTL
eukprot:1158170-Pyramimonas_sp.AAC.1